MSTIINMLSRFGIRQLLILASLTLLCAQGAVYAEAVSADPKEKQETSAILLDPLHIISTEIQPSQVIRQQVDGEFLKSRSVTYVDGSLLQTLNPVNISDTLRYNAPGLVTTPWDGDRFGGGTKIRTFGDWGAATSIDGLPAFRSAGQEGGGYTGTMIPSIAIESVSVLKGSQGVQYGDGTDGGTIVTRLKSGAQYQNHRAISADYSTAGEFQGQAELANGTDKGDYYIAGRWLEGDYDGEPANLDKQQVKGLVGKFGWNINKQTRAESFFVYDNSKPTIYRGGALNKIDTKAVVAALTIDHELSSSTSVQGGYFYSDTRSQWPDRNRDRSIKNNIVFLNAYMLKEISSTLSWAGNAGLEYMMVDAYRDNLWHNTFNDVSLKSSNSLTIEDNLVLNLGLRYTWFDNEIRLEDVTQPDNLRTDGLFSYEVGASYSVSDNLRMRAVVASGYNRFFSKYGNFGEDALDLSGAGDEVVESMNYEVGMRFNWDESYLDMALYKIDQKGVPRRNSGRLESMKVKQRGLEMELFTALSSQLSMSAGYMHVFDLKAIREDGSQVNGNIFWDGQVAPVPDNQLSLRVNYNISQAWSVWGAGFYNSGFTATDASGGKVERRDYERLDLGLAWRFNDFVTARIRIENLTNEKDFGATVEGNPVNGAGKVGRTTWLGIDFTF